MAEVAIILNNTGNDRYLQTAREFLTSPVKADLLKIILEDESQIANILKIRNETSFGRETNRDIQLQQYVSAENSTNLIIDVPLSPAVVLDGQTYFEIVLNAGTTLYLLFYFDQNLISGLLT